MQEVVPDQVQVVVGGFVGTQGQGVGHQAGKSTGGFGWSQGGVGRGILVVPSRVGIRRVLVGVVHFGW